MRRLFAATFLVALIALTAGCAERVPSPPSAPQAERPTLLPPPPEKGAEKLERPEAIAKPAAPKPAPPAKIEAEPLLPTVPSAPVVPAVPGAPERVAVGVLVPLTGPQAEIGAALVDAAQMALFDIGDESLTLVLRDTGGTPEGAARAASEALDAGARIILGPLLATEVAAVAPVARAAAVEVVAFSNDRTVAGPGVFVMGLLPRDQVARVVSYAVSQGRSRLAALVPDTPFGTAVADALRSSAMANNAVVTDVQTYTPGADVSPVVKRLANYESRKAALDAEVGALEAKGDEVSRQAAARLKASGSVGDLGFDAVMIPEGGERLRSIAPLLPYYDIDTDKVRLLGTSLWNDVSLGTEPALQGGWFAAPDPAPRADFIARFTALYGRRPHRLASLGYDATALAAVLARGSAGPDFSAAALTAAHGFTGVDGLFRFHPDGLSERGLAVLEIHRGEFKVVSPAPEAFTTVVY
jgi:ABC-type branched-subunit amino acid transport system substrate-binding protein